MRVNFRKHFDYDVEKASDEATIPADQQGESLTVQSQSEDADINVMMRRMGITGKMPENPRIPTYGDFTGVSDFQSALHALDEAQDAFMEYPAEFRSRFENSPQKFLEFCSKREENFDEMAKLGLIKQEAVDARDKARHEAAEAAKKLKAAELQAAARAAGWAPPGAAPGST